MDGFDDLLSSSSHGFGENPFANPFDKPRSNSPDPWSTFDPHQHENHAAHFVEGSSTSTEDAQAETVSLGDHMEEATYHEDEHGFEGAAHEVRYTQSSEAAGIRGPETPGFRESVPTEDAVSQESEEPPGPSRHSPVPSEPHATSDVLSTSKAPVTSPQPSSNGVLSKESNLNSTPSLSSPSNFVSPLTYSTSQAFANLSLGGESTGGWQDERIEHTVSTTAMSASSQDKKEETPQGMGSSAVPADEQENGLPTNVDSASKPIFSISVEDPQKVGDPIRPYILYTVHTKTTSPLYSKPSFSVLRRYSDFLWLYETLSLNNPGVIVPPVPEKNSFGRFANLFVQQRRLALEICIQKIANHPLLAKDPDLKLFLESDNFALDIKHRKIEIAQERGGIISSIGQTLTGPKFFEVDDWFDRKKAYLDGLESQLRGLVKSIDSVSKQREDLAIAAGEFALSIGELSESDLNKQLCNSLSIMSTVERKTQDLLHIQAQEDTITFMTTAEEYSRIINSVRMAFASRVRCHTQWQNAESELRRVKQAHEKARAQGRIPQDRMAYSLSQIAEAERRVVDVKHDFERCSKLVKIELARFEEERVHDFKIALEMFLEGMIVRQKELIVRWESYQELLLKKANLISNMSNSEGSE